MSSPLRRPRLKPLHFDYSWLKKGATVLLSGPATRRWRLLEKKSHCLRPPSVYTKLRQRSCRIRRYCRLLCRRYRRSSLHPDRQKANLPPLKESTSIGQIINGDKPFPSNRMKKWSSCALCGYGRLRCWAGGYEIYQNALKKKNWRTLIIGGIDPLCKGVKTFIEFNLNFFFYWTIMLYSKKITLRRINLWKSIVDKSL